MTVYKDRWFNPSLYQFCFSKALFLHCFSRHGCPMSTRLEDPREERLFSFVNSPEGIALKNQFFVSYCDLGSLKASISIAGRNLMFDF